MMYWGYPEDVAGLNPLELSGQRLALNNIWIPIIRTLHVDAGKGFSRSLFGAMLVLAFTASLLPARRAASTNPIRAE
jgi:ABC-type lipoprotein release transport system permease subunit